MFHTYPNGYREWRCKALSNSKLFACTFFSLSIRNTALILAVQLCTTKSKQRSSAKPLSQTGTSVYITTAPICLITDRHSLVNFALNTTSTYWRKLQADLSAKLSCYIYEITYTDPGVLQRFRCCDTFRWVDGEHLIDEVFCFRSHRIPLWGGKLKKKTTYVYIVLHNPYTIFPKDFYWYYFCNFNC